MMFPLRLVAAGLSGVFVFGLLPGTSEAMPALARQYNVACAVCHDAFPRLNTYGEQFAADNFRMPHWWDTMADLGDPRLALPMSLPLAMRAQAYVRGTRRRGHRSRDGADRQ